MIIGVPKEIETHEYRIGINPAGVRQLGARGHEVVIESEGGLGAGFSDDVFELAGTDGELSLHAAGSSDG